MIVKLKDGTEVSVTLEQSENLKKAIAQGVAGVEVNGIWFRCDWVAVIKGGGEPKAPPERRIAPTASISDEDRLRARQTIEKARKTLFNKH